MWDVQLFAYVAHNSRRLSAGSVVCKNLKYAKLLFILLVGTGKSSNCPDRCRTFGPSISLCHFNVLFFPSLFWSQLFPLAVITLIDLVGKSAGSGLLATEIWSLQISDKIWIHYWVWGSNLLLSFYLWSLFYSHSLLWTWRVDASISQRSVC